MKVKLGTTITKLFPIHDSDMYLVAPFALPTADVYEDDGDAASDNPTVEQVGAEVGKYRVIIAVTVGNGYEVGKTYNVMVNVTLDGVNYMAANVATFEVETANMDDVMTKLNDLISTPAGLITIETPWVVGYLPTGLTVEINIYNSAGLAELLTDQACVEFISGFYRWDTSNMTNYPATVGLYYWVMKDDHNLFTASGMAAIGTPTDVGAVVEDAVWDAARADHTDAGSMGETMTDAQAVVESLDELIEDDGGGNMRFTEKALEEGPGTDPADIFAYVPTGLEPADSVAERIVDITDNTDRVDGLIEDDGLGADRFTAKALEEAPGTSAASIWDYVPTGLEPANSVAEKLTEAHLNTEEILEAMDNMPKDPEEWNP